MRLAEAENQSGIGTYIANLSGKDINIKNTLFSKCPEGIYKVLKDSLVTEVPVKYFNHEIVKKSYILTASGIALLLDFIKRDWNIYYIVDLDIYHAINELRIQNKHFEKVYEKFVTADQLTFLG